MTPLPPLRLPRRALVPTLCVGTHFIDAPRHSYRPRRAYTLVEMLIVVSIMIMLVAVALPVAKKTMEGSHTREASRQLHSYFAMAKSRALQTGRPCGLYFAFPTSPLGINEPFATAANATRYWPVRQVTQVFLAEVPAPYAGSTTTAVAKIETSTGTPLLRIWNSQIGVQPNGWMTDTSEVPFLYTSGTPSIPVLLFNGEQFLVRFNYKGDWYICVNNNGVFNYIRPLQGTVLPYGYGNTSSPGVPFQILRSPRAIGNPMDLPRGTCIDITYSGVGNSSREFPLPIGLAMVASNLSVMLAPNGGIDSMYINGAPTPDPVGSLYFLIGKVEKAGDPYASINPSTYNQAIYADSNPDPIRQTSSNLSDPGSLWVVVNRGTGQVTTAENMPVPSAAAGADIRPYLTAARQAAILGEQMGGQ